ncbi:MAG TPA: hypothetical protein P5556_06085 [Candidatus Gastranaerophilales bacterium]|nr:hypothetical protein [Candidatus Gastranaerophilales bacterium]
MSDKCNKYESLFIFATEEALAKHLEICEDCRHEHAKMKKTETLIKEIKPYYKKIYKKRLDDNIVKIAAGFIILSLTYFSANYLNLMNSNINTLEISYAENESIVAEMGLPTDEYGLLTVY